MYDSQKYNTIAQSQESEKRNNQIVLTGTDSIVMDKGVFMLEFLDASAPVTILDGAGVTIGATASFAQDHSPLRCNKGVSFSGSVRMVKGYKIESVI